MLDERSRLIEVLTEIDYFQQIINKMKTKHFGHLLIKLVGTDTIPVMFITKRGEYLRLMSQESHYSTTFFRIEEVDEVKQMLSLALLCPLNMEGQPASRTDELMSLKKTTETIKLNIANIAAVQLASTTLLSTSIMIESKW